MFYRYRTYLLLATRNSASLGAYAAIYGRRAFPG